MCGATVRNHGTKVWGKTRFKAGGATATGPDSVIRSAPPPPRPATAKRSDAGRSVPRVELARQPENDLREDDAQQVARRLQADEGHRRLEDRGHADLRWRDALQIEQRVPEGRAEERHLHVDDEDDAVPEGDVVRL